MKYKSLLSSLIQEAQASHRRLIIAIDGRCASGKTTLANSLAEQFQLPLFHMDDFYLPKAQQEDTIAGHMDLKRFKQEILIPLSRNQDVVYRAFDCQSQTYCEPICFHPSNIILIEGSYALHPELVEYYDVRLFLDIDAQLQKERILMRNPDSAEMFFTKWIPKEEAYIEAYQIERYKQ